MLTTLCVVVWGATLIVFFMVAGVLSRDTFELQGPLETHVNSEQIGGAAVYFIFLGIAWIFGPIAIRTGMLRYEYLFCIGNALLGLTIFVVRVVMYREASAAWSQLLTDGTFRHSRSSPQSPGSAESTLSRAPEGGSVFAQGIITASHGAFQKATEPLASDIPRHRRGHTAARYIKQNVNFAEPLEYERPPTPTHLKYQSNENPYSLGSGGDITVL